MYNLVRKFLFLFDAEQVHYFSMNFFKILLKVPFAKKLLTRTYTVNRSTLIKYAFGLTFRNSIGLAAGFDKNAEYLDVMKVLGFGFTEIGTVTPLPQIGNDKPRIFRLPKDKAIINRMGFNNEGVQKVAERIKIWREKNPKAGNDFLIIGGNIGKNKNTRNEEARRDYEICFKELFPYVDYFVVNVSSPNTPGLRELQQKDSLRKIFLPLISFNNSQPSRKPLLLKVAPDLNVSDVDDIIELALELKLDGLVVANTTISRDGLVSSKNRIKAIGAGGLSGLPLKNKSTDLIKYIAQKTQGQLTLIGSGGVFTAADVQEKMNAGATFVQLWTGFIYEGPGIVSNICRHFVKTF
ncbi:quinone-dependent dihydroorotate dehydrogenase [soil metagenome]